MGRSIRRSWCTPRPARSWLRARNHAVAGSASCLLHLATLLSEPGQCSAGFQWRTTPAAWPAGGVTFRGPRSWSRSGRDPPPSVDDRSTLFAHELRDVVHRQPGLARRATPLPATERLDPRPGTRRRAGTSVDVQDAGLDRVEELLDLRLVLAVDAGGQPEHVVVRERECLVERIHRRYRGQRREQLVAEQPVRGRQPADDGRLDVVAAREIAVREVLAAGEHGSVAPRLGDGRLVTVDGALVDDRPQPVRPDERVAELDLLRLLDEQPDELVMDGPLDVDPGVGRALLPAEPEGAAHDALGRLVEVRVPGDDGRVLAAHLDDARARPRLREPAEQLHPALVRAGEDDPVDARVILERLADRVAWPHHHVDDALGETRLDVGHHQVDRRQRRGAPALGDDRVAGGRRVY